MIPQRRRCPQNQLALTATCSSPAPPALYPPPRASQPKRVTLKALTKVGTNWLTTLPAVFALARAVGAYRNPRASRVKPAVLAVAALLLSPAFMEKAVAPLLAEVVPKVVPVDVTREVLVWTTLYLLDVATRA
jgi:hypothetical protein